MRAIAAAFKGPDPLSRSFARKNDITSPLLLTQNFGNQISRSDYRYLPMRPGVRALFAERLHFDGKFADKMHACCERKKRSRK
jgi:hypothetical protein